MSILTVGELIERLENCDPQSPIALAIQPSWPFEYTLSDVEEADDGKVYLAEGAQVAYLSAAGRRALGW